MTSNMRETKQKKGKKIEILNVLSLNIQLQTAIFTEFSENRKIEK